MSRKRYTFTDTQKRRRAPSDREKAVAYFLAGGDKPPMAVKRAGYSASVVRYKAARICKRETVKRALLEIEESIRPGELTRMGRALIQKKLTSAKKLDRDTL